MTTKNIVFSFVFVLGAFATGCAASEPESPAPAQSPAEQAQAPRGAEGPSSAAPDLRAEAPVRGELVQTVAASSATSKETGVAVWAIYREGRSVTTYGFDAEGNVKTQLRSTLAADAKTITITAPGAGVRSLTNDGKVVENTFDASKMTGLAAMARDYEAQTANGEIPYSCGGAWFRLGIAGVRLGMTSGDDVFAWLGAAGAVYDIYNDC